MFGLLHSSVEHVEVSSRTLSHSLNAASKDVAPFCSQASPFHPRIHTAPPRISSTPPQNIKGLKKVCFPVMVLSFLPVSVSRVVLTSWRCPRSSKRQNSPKKFSAFIFRPRTGFTYLPASRPDGFTAFENGKTPKKMLSSYGLMARCQRDPRPPLITVDNSPRKNTLNPRKKSAFQLRSQSRKRQNPPKKICFQFGTQYQFLLQYPSTYLCRHSRSEPDDFVVCCIQ
jgi:hypothetical protein